MFNPGNRWAIRCPYQSIERFRHPDPNDSCDRTGREYALVTVVLEGKAVPILWLGLEQIKY